MSITSCAGAQNGGISFVQKWGVHHSHARLTVQSQGYRNADIWVSMRVVGGSVDRIDDPNRPREIELILDGLFAEKSMLRKLGAQVLANERIRTQIRSRDKFIPLLLSHLVFSLTRPFHDEVARSCGGGNSFVQSQLEFNFILHLSVWSANGSRHRESLQPNPGA